MYPRRVETSDTNLFARSQIPLDGLESAGGLAG
jgi:hypothetical protein